MARTAKQRAALRKAQLASARKRRRGIKPKYGYDRNGRKSNAPLKSAAKKRAAARIIKSDQNRRARLHAIQSGKKPPKRTNAQKIRSGAATGATYGGMGTLSLKGAAVGYVAGGAITAAAIGAGSAHKKLKRVRANRRAKVKRQ